jgi:hypothetical protein
MTGEQRVMFCARESSFACTRRCCVQRRARLGDSRDDSVVDGRRQGECDEDTRSCCAANVTHSTQSSLQRELFAALPDIIADTAHEVCAARFARAFVVRTR